VGQGAYQHSHFLRYTEEAVAEAFATKNLWKGLAHPLTGGYGINPINGIGEGGAYVSFISGGMYSTYKLINDP